MPKTKVLFAYCHELEKIVSINDARTEFFSIKPEERKRFTFSCSDRNCNVIISGVNYHIKAEDGVKFRAAHFRSPHPHMFGCEWTQFTDDADQDRRPDEAEHDFTERKARRKLTDCINCFDPSIDDPDAEASGSGLPTSLGLVMPTVGIVHPGAGDGSRWSHYTRTNQLQRLVDSWQEAKEKLPFNEFMALRIKVINIGQVHLNKYITHIQKGVTNQYNGVVYGGGTLVHRYGRGFLIKFFDRYDDKSIRLYVDKDVMSKGGFGHYVDEILNTENVRYFRVFLLNPIASERKNSTGQSVINLEILKLRQLAIYYELNSSKEDEAVSAGKDGDNSA
ncbi:hypothetical protein AAET24_003992 [Salmonella enterica]|nr:hypothetical protein [Salmonella enterica]EEH7633987.1 hypothetical protein [Salmonella enterica]